MLKSPTVGSLAAVMILILGLTAFAAEDAHYQYWRLGNSQSSSTRPRPGFALIGGGADLDDAFAWLCEKSDKGDFLVLRATGGDAYDSYIYSLCKNNSVATLLIPNRSAAFDSGVVRRIEDASAIFISGGDQGKYVSYWMNTPVQRAINDAIRRGIPVGGTSAGLAVQGEYMYSAQNDAPEGPDLSSELALGDPFLSRITLVRNFLRIPPLQGTITDTHFSRRNRMGRLLIFMARIVQSNDTKVIHAIGVDEHTAVLLATDGRATVVGTGAAYFLAAKHKAEVCQPHTPLRFSGISAMKLKAGDTFDTTKWTGNGTPYVLSVRNGIVQSTQPGGAIY
jgi:cyanophycinase